MIVDYEHLYAAGKGKEKAVKVVKEVKGQSDSLAAAGASDAPTALIGKVLIFHNLNVRCDCVLTYCIVFQLRKIMLTFFALNRLSRRNFRLKKPRAECPLFLSMPSKTLNLTLEKLKPRPRANPMQAVVVVAMAAVTRPLSRRPARQLAAAAIRRLAPSMRRMRAMRRAQGVLASFCKPTSSEDGSLRCN